jgi:hypothetical protein
MSDNGVDSNIPRQVSKKRNALSLESALLLHFNNRSEADGPKFPRMQKCIRLQNVNTDRFTDERANLLPMLYRPSIVSKILGRLDREFPQ